MSALAPPRVTPLRFRATLAVENGVWNASATVMGALAGALGSIMIVRSISLEAYGALSYYVWLATIVSTLGTLAFPSAVVKITSELRGNQRRLEARALSRRVAVGLVSVNLVLGAAVLLWALRTPEPDRVYLLLIALVVAPNALAAVLRAILWGQERYRPVSVALGVSAVIQLGLVVIAHVLGWGAPGFAIALLSTGGIQAVMFAFALTGPSRPHAASTPAAALEPATLRRFFAFAVPATIVLLSEVVVWQRSEIFFLQRFSELAEVGFYNLASTVFGVFLTAGWALVHGFYPAISRDYGGGERRSIQDNVRRGLVLATLFAIPLSFGGWATLGALVSLLYTQKMLPAATVGHVLLAGLLPGVIGGLLSLTVKAVGGIWVHVRLGMAVLVVNVVLALLLVPTLGALGGAVANTCCQILYAALLLSRVRRMYEVGLPWRTLGGITSIGASTTFLVPALVQFWVPGPIGVLGAVTLGGCLYVLAIWRRGYLRALGPAVAMP